MTRLLSLSRAARLVGVTRVALQKKIQDGLLPAFEGMVTEEGLVQAYPDIQFADDTSYDRMAQTKKLAHDARAAERLPSKEVLAARLTSLGKDLSDAQAELHRYRSVADGLEQQLAAWNDAGEDLQAAAASLRAWMHQTLQDNQPHAGFRNLAIRDSFLRVMASNVQVQPSGHEFFVDGTDTVLEAALRAGVALDYACSDGNCGKCKARVVSGEVMQVRPHEYVLSEEEKAAGHALMCCNTAVSDVVIEAGEANAAADIPVQAVIANVRSIERLGDEMILLQLQTPPTHRLRFLAGQNVKVRFGQSLSAVLPVAGCPCDDRSLPFHIPNRAGNYFSEHVATKLQVGDTVTVEGPSGDFVLRKDSPRPPLFVALGHGFAALKGLMEQTVSLDAADSMHLYWVVSHEPELYFGNWPRAMAHALDNFHYTPLVATTNLETAGSSREPLLGALLARIADDHPVLSDFDVYIAGPEPLLDAGRKWLLEHGVPDTQLRVSVVR